VIGTGYGTTHESYLKTYSTALPRITRFE